MAIGFLEVAGYGAAIYAMDKACKHTAIKIIGIDTINPKDTSANIPLTVQVKFEGSASDVKLGVQVAREHALRFNEEKEITTSVIEKPYEGTYKLGYISKVKFRDEEE